MRAKSVGQTKSDKRGTSGKRDRPHPETKAGRLFAALMTGEFVSTHALLGGYTGRAVEDFRSYYGMEIEGKKGRTGGVRLLGEWDGPYFVPVERMRPYPEPEDYRQPKN